MRSVNAWIFAVSQSLFFLMLSLAHMWLVGALHTGSCVLSALPTHLQACPCVRVCVRAHVSRFSCVQLYVNL